MSKHIIVLHRCTHYLCRQPQHPGRVSSCVHPSHQSYTRPVNFPVLCTEHYPSKSRQYLYQTPLSHSNDWLEHNRADDIQPGVLDVIKLMYIKFDNNFDHTFASLIPQELSQIVPHSPLNSISTRPSPCFVPPTSFTGYSETIVSIIMNVCRCAYCVHSWTKINFTARYS